MWMNYGIEQFHLTMSKFPFKFLLQHLRFDDMDTHAERRETDKLVQSGIYLSFVEKCKSAYIPFQNEIIGEKLEAFRTRCSFHQIIPSKPNKYELKIYAMVYSKTFYASNLDVYVGHN